MAIQSVYQTERPCEHCGALYVPPFRRDRSIILHCSDACRALAKRKRISALRGLDRPAITERRQKVRTVVVKVRVQPKPKRPKRKAYEPPVPLPRPLPKSGRRPWSDEARWRKGARMLGISFEAYRDQVQAGNKWCSRCRTWQPIGEFGPHKRLGIDTVCMESSRKAAREWQRSHRTGQAS